MKIHFVCTGNVYRSRLAEAYLKSKQLPDVEVSSSGILAQLDYDINGPIGWVAMRILQNQKLIPYMSNMSTQTTPELLDTADLIIFMKGNHHTFSKNELGFVKENYEIWDIPDIDDLPGFENFTDMDAITASEQTFRDIKEKVEDLVKRLQN